MLLCSVLEDELQYVVVTGVVAGGFRGGDGAAVIRDDATVVATGSIALLLDMTNIEIHTYLSVCLSVLLAT